MIPVKHVAIIMDGNGRWAERRGMPRWRGHEAGVAAVRRATEAACEQAISVMTLFAFSSENWRRPAREVNILFSLFRRYLVEARTELTANGIRLSAIGRRDRFSPTVRETLEETESLTRPGTRLHLRLAIDYGARAEIVEAARRIAGQAAAGIIKPERIDEAVFERALPAGGEPDPDLIIRTAGERRISNFLLWQAAYAEFYFCPRMWPDFTGTDLEEALADYQGRTRKFGALPCADGTLG
jgi:undecaprenyl diphosphate synthase